jgi:hypothetical protein
MKKILFVLMLFLAISLSQAVTVERSMNSAIDFGKTLAITFIINPENSTSFEFTDAVPTEWQFVDWNIQGINKENVVFSNTATSLSDNSKEIYKWKFENATGLITLTYDIIVKTAGEEKLTALWIVGNGIESKESTIVVRSTGAVCGNAICETAYGENNFTCPTDCNFKMNVFFWLGLLLTATIISISGIYFREYNKVKAMPRQKPKGHTQVIAFEMKERPKEISQIKTIREQPRQKIVKQRTQRKTVKQSRVQPKKKAETSRKKSKPKKIARKPVTRPSKNKSEKLYKETLSRLDKIKKGLRT